MYPHYIREKYDLKWSVHQRWYYLKNMLESECLLIKIMIVRWMEEHVVGSITIGAVNGTNTSVCAHSAFFDAATAENARMRESIEVRAMVFLNEDQ